MSSSAVTVTTRRASFEIRPPVPIASRLFLKLIAPAL